MPRFFVDAVHGDTTVITGEDAKHITKSLRARPGEILTLCDKSGRVFTCEVLSLGDAVTLRVLESFENAAEPQVCVRLFQAMPKGDKFEFILQKAVELGAAEMIPVLTRRCISRPDAKTMEKKLARYRKISEEAAKQAGRGIVPAVHPMVNFPEAISMMKRAQAGILFFESGGDSLSQFVKPEASSVDVMIGSEGGFDTEEVELARAQGMHICTLGKRILRCETAPVAALAIIMHLTGNV